MEWQWCTTNNVLESQKFIEAFREQGINVGVNEPYSGIRGGCIQPGTTGADQGVTIRVGDAAGLF